MAAGMRWEDLPTVLEGPGTEIRRRDHDGLAMCLIRLEAGVRTDPVFAGLPGDRCGCAHWGHIVRGAIRVHGPDGSRDFEAGESSVFGPGSVGTFTTDLKEGNTYAVLCFISDREGGPPHAIAHEMAKVFVAGE